MMIGVLGSLAEYERELVKKRTALKRATSRANGTKFGRPRKVDDANTSTAKRMKADGHAATHITVVAAALSVPLAGIATADPVNRARRGGPACRCQPERWGRDRTGQRC
jgi:DNA invertase Pin-like site-specific DNA recombinase